MEREREEERMNEIVGGMEGGKEGEEGRRKERGGRKRERGGGSERHGRLRSYT